MPKLVDNHAALLLVDGDVDDVKDAIFWVTTPKASPATRRIPVFAVTDNPKLHYKLLLAGADMVLGVDEVQKDGQRLIADFVRVVTPEQQAQLDCDCHDALPALAQQGIAKFNAGEFYKQHDLFEALWMETESPVRDLYRAILQVGVAYYQIERGNHRGARKMLLRSLQWLTILPDVCQGVDVAALKADSARVREALETTQSLKNFDMSLLKPVKMV